MSDDEGDQIIETHSGAMNELLPLLRMLAEGGGSDLHIKAGSAAMIRENGSLQRVDGPKITPQQAAYLAFGIVPEDRRERFDQEGEVDFALSVPRVGRFRVNVFRQRGSVSMVLRKLRTGGPTFEELGLPPVVQRLSEENRGLVLVTGPTGCGKTTTLASMIQYINATRPVHIVTIEDPIEVLHADAMGSVNQREIGQDSRTFLTALRAALRQDPDVILIGEMRDPETVSAALQAAETGHLVLSTLHTVDATETVNRIVDFFPPHQQHQARYTLAGCLRGVLCQRLVKGATGGQVVTVESMVNTGRIAERIMDPMKTNEIHQVMSEGEYYGMRTFDQALVDMVRKGLVTPDDAMEAASSPHDFELQLKSAGVVDPNLSFAR
jgi:twitching motility protein PilT